MSPRWKATRRVGRKVILRPRHVEDVKLTLKLNKLQLMSGDIRSRSWYWQSGVAEMGFKVAKNCPTGCERR